MKSIEKAKFIITCEHGGNKVPGELAEYFSKACKILENHRGYDIGGLELARKISAGLEAPFFYSETTRLVVDLNRSTFSKNLFSEFTCILNKEEKDRILEKYYFPYRNKVETEITRLAEEQGVIHIAVHSFTPVMNDKVRNADIGFLYDPKRKPEKTFCSLWKQKLDKETPSFRTRMNYPYRGISDCLPLKLKKILQPEKYIGIELEINNKIFENPALTKMLHEALLKTLMEIKEQQF
ncbi:N-formylglutamate amidohydrolase [Desulforegula conservatrix]|uniref:N-formylglutamate amidohydrolase n=1 Tax=Desulforegula conservatrix TaxID=153026 RepID=UPI0004237393|nr:N-formylglutamate amidohydrolase [Desulforegula conservatrix]